MKAVRGIVICLIVLGSLFFLFGPEVIPDNFQLQEGLNLSPNKDVIIIFNSGGWGNTPLQEARDFSPIIEGIQSALNDWGYNSMVIPYKRTENTFLGEITGAKDFLNSFDLSSEIFAEDIEFLAKSFPNKTIIITGLSSGGAFATKTYEKVSAQVKNSVFVITAGTPFWIKSPESENILQLNNIGKDSLAKGEIKTLFLSLFKSPFKWVLAKVSGENLSLSRITNQFIGHTYDWNTVAPEITPFLENKISPP